MGLSTLQRFASGIYPALIIAIIVTGCGSKPRQSVMGEWSGEMLSISNPKGDESVTIPIAKYGYLNLSLHSDSTYEFSLGVLKDVRVEKKVFEYEASTVLIPAVYKSTRYGRWMRTDSTYVLESTKGAIYAHPSPDRESMRLNFKDDRERIWDCSLSPKD